MTIKDPDRLLENVGRSIMAKAIVISAVVHGVVIFGTSFGLYADWAEFGVHSPSTIKLMRKAREEKAEEDARRQTREETAASEDTHDAKNDSEVTSPVEPTDRVKPDATAPTAPELEPLPPKAGFTLGEDFNL